MRVISEERIIENWEQIERRKIQADWMVVFLLVVGLLVFLCGILILAEDPLVGEVVHYKIFLVTGILVILSSLIIYARLGKDMRVIARNLFPEDSYIVCSAKVRACIFSDDEEIKKIIKEREW